MYISRHPSSNALKRQLLTICCVTKEIMCTVEFFFPGTKTYLFNPTLVLAVTCISYMYWLLTVLHCYIKIRILLWYRLIDLFHYLIVPNQCVHKADILTLLSCIYCWGDAPGWTVLRGDWLGGVNRCMFETHTSVCVCFADLWLYFHRFLTSVYSCSVWCHSECAVNLETVWCVSGFRSRPSPDQTLYPL